jgi:hypothetical protein
VGAFFIDTATGQVATQRQLTGAGLTDRDGTPTPPWHRIPAPSDASTMWYAVLRKRTRGIFIGAVAFRHGGQYPSLLAGGWEEVSIEDIGASLPAQRVEPGGGEAQIT